MTDIEVAEELVKCVRTLKKRNWMRDRRKRQPETYRRELQQAKDRRVRLRAFELMARGDEEALALRMRNADMAFASRMNGLRFEDQPGAD